MTTPTKRRVKAIQRLIAGIHLGRRITEEELAKAQLEVHTLEEAADPPSFGLKAGDCCASKWNGGDAPRHVTIRMIGQGIDRTLVGFTRCGSCTDGIITWEAFVDAFTPCTDTTHNHTR